MKNTFTSENFLIKLLASVVLLVLFSSNSFAQTILYNENFNADSTALPVGWSTIGNGWHVETSNVSSGYPGASGLVNVAVRNDSATGVYSLISKSISTVGYNTISVIWGTRLTVNFPTSGSSIQGMYWSSDNGVTWNTLAYTENASNSTWSLDNGGIPVVLPVAANNQASIKFKLTVSIVNNANGTYRIDDFTVGGISSVGIVENQLSLANVKISPNPSSNETKLNFNAQSNLKISVDVFDILGKQTGNLSDVAIPAGNSSIQLNESLFPVNGIYFIRIKTGDEIQTLRFIKN